MFGYIYVNEQELKLKEFTTYRSFYCGLCRDLHHRYGRTAQMMLNYDLTFLALLLSGLYEPKTRTGEERCLTHPVSRHRMAENEAISYAADMTVLLSYQKMRDNWEDEHSVPGRAAAALLKKDYRKIAEKYPRQAQAVEENIHLLAEAEHENNRDIDYVSGLTGRFLAEIFVWKEDVWQADLRQIGFYLGKFIYLLDALEDVRKDRKKKNFNLFSECGDVWSEEQEPKYREMLTGMASEAARAFERLPVIRYSEIIRNVLYSGIWCRYAAVRDGFRKIDSRKKNTEEQE